MDTPAKVFHDLVEEAVNKRIDDDWLKRARAALKRYVAAEQSVPPTNDGLTHADSESTPAVISG